MNRLVPLLSWVRSPARSGPWLAVVVVIPLLMATVDRPLAEWARSLPPDVIAVAQTLTVVGDSKWWLITLAALLPFALAARVGLRGSPSAATAGWVLQALLFVFAAVALSGLAVDAIKPIVGRARPILLETQGFYGFRPFTFRVVYYSFPSGHADTVIVLALAFGFLIERGRGALLAVGAVFALTRVVIGAHFFGDVVGGSAIAVATTYPIRAWCAGRAFVFVRGPDGAVEVAPAGRRARAALAAAVGRLRPRTGAAPAPPQPPANGARQADTARPAEGAPAPERSGQPAVADDRPSLL